MALRAGGDGTSDGVQKGESGACKHGGGEGLLSAGSSNRFACAWVCGRDDGLRVMQGMHGKITLPTDER